MVQPSKVLSIVLDGSGSYLGMEKGCFVVRDRNGEVKRFPLFEGEIGEVVLKSGNFVSTGALASLGFWGVDVWVLTRRGRPVALLRSLDDYSHVKTRICQYKALENGKGVYIAKQIVLSKVRCENMVLERYGLPLLDIDFVERRVEGLEGNLKSIRRKLMSIEGKCSKQYFREIFSLLPESLRPSSRRTFHAYDGVNNIFNFAYEVLSWKVFRALVKAKLEPYLGFLHSVQFGKPSLVCDFQELYRCFIDNFLIEYCQSLRAKDFKVKSERVSKTRVGKRIVLNDSETNSLMGKLNRLFRSKVKIPRIKYGENQEVETLINEEALLLAKFLRGERRTWIPRLIV